MVAKHRLRRARIIFGAHGKDDAALFEIEGVSLQREVRLPDGAAFSYYDSLGAIIANDPSPECIVEVEYEAFSRLPAAGTYDPRDKLSELWCGVRSDLNLSLKPSSWIEPLGETVLGYGAFEVEPEDTISGGCLREAVIQTRDEPTRSSRRKAIEATE
jgi:hypothetical protein